VATDPEKVRAIEDWVTPQDLTGLRAFLGLVGYYRQYIPDFARIAQPVNRLIAKRVTWQCTPTKQKAFECLKGRLLETPILAYPDPNLDYILDTDASDQNVSAVPSQVQEGREVVVAFSYRIEHRPGKKHGNADGLSQQPAEGCRQCLNIEKRDRAPPRSELRALAHPGMEYDWDQGQLRQKTGTPPEAINHLRANPVLADNVRELRKLQENLSGVVAKVY